MLGETSSIKTDFSFIVETTAITSFLSSAHYTQIFLGQFLQVYQIVRIQQLKYYYFCQKFKRWLQKR
jgi:hypothetical protein